MYCVKYRVCTVLTDAQHTIQYDHVSVLLREPAGPCVFSLHTLCTWLTWSQEEFTESERYCWATQSLESATLKSLGFISAKLLSWHLISNRKQRYSTDSAPAVFPISDFLKSLSQVVQCVQSVKNTVVQWFPTRGMCRIMNISVAASGTEK